MITVAPLLNKIDKYILNPIIMLLFMAALALFFWGIVQFIMNQEGDQAREVGKRNMLWGIIGLFIMVSVYGIIDVILVTLGLPSPQFIP